MNKAAAVGFAVVCPALLVAAAACSAKPKQHPPTLGDCLPEAGCLVAPPAPASGSGGSSGTGGAAGGSGTAQDGGSTCGDVQASGAACQACMDRACCQQNGDCTGSCLDLVDCLTACTPGDANCVASCSNEFAEGAPAYNALAQCLQGSCATSCQSSGSVDAAVSCGTLSFAPPACTTCMNEVCCDAALKCSNNPDCVIIEQCAQYCLPADADCRASCTNLGPTGTSAFQSLYTCMTGSCGTICP
jgi:hypothetical protein